MKTLIFLIFYFNCAFFTLYAQNIPSTSKEYGIIVGKVLDAETQSTITGAVIKVLETDFRTATDLKGEYRFDDIKYGTYRMEINMIGYLPLIKSNIVVSSPNPLEVIIELNSSNITTENINVEASYFQKNFDMNVSGLNLDYEDIRRSPGAVEDISRMLQSAPGVSIGTDQRNDLLVRGGSPIENLFLIDNIDIPNINHYGSLGSTGGAISFLNIKLIRVADIFTGGFNSKYGDRLSSVVDIKFREGSYTTHINNIDFNIAGFGGLFEGPITKNFSYIVSLRRSYLDLLKNAIRLTAVPNYWDFNMKLNYKFDDNNSLSLIGFSALDKINFKVDENTKVDDWPYDSDNKTNTYTGGLNYTHLFKSGYFQAILSNSYTTFFSDNIYVPTGKREYYENSYENESSYKFDLVYKLSKYFNLNFGAGGKYTTFKNNLYSVSDTTPLGYIIPELNINNTLNSNKLFANVNLTSKFFEDKLVVNAGLRYDFFNFINLKNTFAPRIGASYKIFPTTSINASYGVFYQTPVSVWLATSPGNKNLSSIRSDHYIFGVEHLITPELNFTAEIYVKQYRGYPVDINNPEYILINNGAGFGPNIIGDAGSVGNGYVRGFDLSVQKKLSGNGLYGLVSYSYSNSGFTALIGPERKAAFDPTHQFTLILGYQVADDWLIGLKFKYMGGKPLTPFDMDLSRQLGRGVWNMSLFNAERYPDYQRLDLRVDKKFYVKKISITTYLELQNVYNKQNVFGYFWNKMKNDLGTIYNWSFMPVGGFNIEF
jgi:outer membrane cobalamin receptor